MKTPTYNVHSVEVGHQPDGTPIAYVTLACTVEEARAAGALLYRDVTLEPVPEGEEDWRPDAPGAAMPGTAVYDLDDPADLPRFLERLRRRSPRMAETLLMPQLWAPPATLRELVEHRPDDLIGTWSKRQVDALREALVEAGLPDLAE